MKTAHQQRIERFMEQAGQKTPDKPCLPDAKIRELRAKLILEEALETIQALGFTVNVFVNGLVNKVPVEKNNYTFAADQVPDLVEVADGCADISVVTIGTLTACGIHDQPVLELVDQNNLDKFGPGHSIRADGKLIKPPDHKPPNVLGELLRQGWVPD